VSALQPHRKRYWLTPPPDDPTELAEQICTVCEVYEATPTLAAAGTHVMSTDEMTGMQALERLHPSLPIQPGHVERQEFEYKRHGTQSLIANLDVASGQVVTPSIGPTRTEADFATHIMQTLQTDPQAAWIFITDQLNTHQSETLVRLVAAQCDIQEELGVKGKSGPLASVSSRAAFLSDPSHRIRFVSTPGTVLGSIRLRSGLAFWSVACCPDSVAGRCKNCKPGFWPLLPTTIARPTGPFDFPYKGSSTRS
jgi:DDE superfamily endonuclease